MLAKSLFNIAKKNSMKEIMFRAHQVGKLMPGPREKEGELSKTVQRELVKIAASIMQGTHLSLKSKYLDKGIEVEEDSLTLKSRIDKRFYKKNTTRISNEIWTGECDILHDNAIYDIKSSWNLESHLLKQTQPLNEDYYWQGQVYLDLYEKENYEVCHCLVNTPAHLIEQEQRSYLYKLGVAPERVQLYDEELADIAREMRFDHLSDKIRYFVQQFKRNQSDIDRAKERMAVCAKWINDNFLND